MSEATSDPSCSAIAAVCRAPEGSGTLGLPLIAPAGSGRDPAARDQSSPAT